MRNKNIDMLKHIKTYCEDIEMSIERFGNDRSIFDMDRDYRNSVCMSLLQIGELTGHLTEDFREGTKETIYFANRQSECFAFWNRREMMCQNLRMIWNTDNWKDIGVCNRGSVVGRSSTSFLVD